MSLALLWPGRPRVSRAAVAVLLIGLVVTGALSWVSYAVNDRNETRLLDLQTKETGTVLQVILPVIQTPLASAAEIAATSSGDVPGFRAYISSYVGPKGTFVSASLWKLSGGSARMVSAVGQTPELATRGGGVAAFVSRAARTHSLDVVGVLGGPKPRLGYAFTSAGTSPSYAVYAESSLPPDKRAAVAPGSPFSSLRFALYLGREARPSMLLESNAAHPPITGRSSTVVVPFGAGALTLVASPAGQLGGRLSGWLWWIVAIAGVVIVGAATVVAERMVRRRRAAESLTRRVQQLLSEQRGIAEAVQRALLPARMPAIAGIQFGTCYIPGVNGVEIGGDWYDVIALDEGRFFFVIGDVSGRGVGAGTVMASLRFAIRGFVSEGHGSAAVLDVLRGVLDLRRDHHFATVLCGIVDIDRHEIVIANAGHLPPLMISGDHGEYVQTAIGPPIGVASGARAETVTVTVPPGGTLLLYTDGLVERRDETLDAGFDRLCAVAVGRDLPLDELLSTLVEELVPGGCEDDTAMLGLRWLD